MAVEDVARMALERLDVDCRQEVERAARARGVRPERVLIERAMSRMLSDAGSRPGLRVIDGGRQ